MRKRLIAGNWKLNGNWALCQQFVDVFASLPAASLDAIKQQVDVVICPTAVYLSRFDALIQSTSSMLQLGAQDVSTQSQGAYTGEIAASMLVEAGAVFGIAGHSERRHRFAETDQQVVQKMLNLFAADVLPIVCVGEPIEQREAGSAEAFIEAQLLPIATAVAEHGLAGRPLAIAYEPIWAVGTGKSATPEQAQSMHAFIRSVMARFMDADSLRIIYGGSVTPANATALMAMADIDGALIGGASLDPEQFVALASV
ncbi:MAG: triose-phosphate isomerase [Pseudomonadales bacterium]|nr:triose-phosphate isomerase [Pseudomonadales bacterium]